MTTTRSLVPLQTFPGTPAEESELIIAAAFGCDTCHPHQATRDATCSCLRLLSDATFANRAVAVRRYGGGRKWQRELEEHRALLALNGGKQ